MMTFEQAQVRLRSQSAKLEQAIGMSGAVRAELERTVQALAEVAGAGYNPRNMMESARSLANEAVQIAEQQQRRVGALMAGLSEMAG